MPGGLKLNVVTSIYSHKTYNFFRSFTSVTGTSSSAAAAAAAVSVSTHTRRCWWGTSISIPASGDFRHRQKLLGFLDKGYANFPLRSISTTQMGPAPDHKEDDLRREKASPPPPPSKSEKLLTLPTILTIGRVAAVPLLVSSKFLNYFCLMHFKQCMLFDD